MLGAGKMSNDLLQRLLMAKSDEERSWIVTENWLESLPNDLATALWAVAIPHWFDAEILVALCPELSDRADELYRQLQELSCVELFAERGYNVHQLMRNQLLEHLWKDNQERFRILSGRVSVYFEKGSNPEIQIERVYHLVIADPVIGMRKLSNLVYEWNSSFRRAELHYLLTYMQQHISANRVTLDLKSFLNSKNKTENLAMTKFLTQLILKSNFTDDEIESISEIVMPTMEAMESITISDMIEEERDRIYRRDIIAQRIHFYLVLFFSTLLVTYLGYLLLSGNQNLREKFLNVFIGGVFGMLGSTAVMTLTNSFNLDKHKYDRLSSEIERMERDILLQQQHDELFKSRIKYGNQGTVKAIHNNNISDKNEG